MSILRYLAKPLSVAVLSGLCLGSLGTPNAEAALIYHVEESFSTPGSIPAGWTASTSDQNLVGIVQAYPDDWRLRLNRVSGAGATNRLFYTGTEGSPSQWSDFEAEAVVRYAQESHTRKVGLMGRVQTAPTNNNVSGYYAYVWQQNTAQGVESYLFIDILSGQAGNGSPADLSLGVLLTENMSASLDYLFQFSALGDELTASLWKQDGLGEYTVLLGEISLTDTTYASGYFGMGTWITTNDRPAYFSDLRLDAIPEPSAILLLGFAGAVCAVYRYRRNS